MSSHISGLQALPGKIKLGALIFLWVCGVPLFLSINQSYADNHVCSLIGADAPMNLTINIFFNQIKLLGCTFSLTHWGASMGCSFSMTVFVQGTFNCKVNDSV